MKSAKGSLPEIYETLAQAHLAGPGGKIAIQQYDDFILLWELSVERECILANCRNCRHGKTPATDFCNLFLPRSHLPASALTPCADPVDEGRSAAITDSIAELIWMLISHVGVLPVLEVATPLDPDVVDGLNRLTQPWINLCLSTYGALFVTIQQGEAGSGVEISPRFDSTIGWFHEMQVADYENPPQVPEINALDEWQLYGDPPARLKLPRYLSFREYFTSHRGEIVAGYTKEREVWRLVALNGLQHGKGEDAIARLFGDAASGESKFGSAVRANVEVFRPWFLGKEVDPARFDCPDDSHQYTHKMARKHHESQVGRSASFAITMTHNLMNDPLTTASSSWETASSFATLLISTPKEIDRLSEAFPVHGSRTDNPGRPNDSDDEVARVVDQIVRVLWDSVDILKIPISRQLMRDQQRKLEEQKNELEDKQRQLQRELNKNLQYSEMYERVQQPLNALLNLSRDLTHTAGELSIIRGDHLQALIANRHALAMLFEEGYSDPKFGRIKISKHRADDYDSYNELATALLAAISIIVGDEFDASPGRLPMVDELKARLSRHVAENKHKNALSILAPRDVWENRQAAAKVAADTIICRLHDEWHRIPFAQYKKKPSDQGPYSIERSLAALDSLKRRVHSNFKPASIALNQSRPEDGSKKTVTLDDLACTMDAAFAIDSSPALHIAAGNARVWDDVALFESESFPFRSVGDLFSAVHAFFKDKSVQSGKLAFSHIAGSRVRTLVIEADLVTQSRIPRPSGILEAGMAEKLAGLLKQFMNPGSDRGSLVLGDFLSPVITLIQTRIERSGHPEIFSDNDTVFVRFEELPFEWQIGHRRMAFISGKD